MILNPPKALVNFEPWDFLESITLEEKKLRKIKIIVSRAPVVSQPSSTRTLSKNRAYLWRSLKRIL